MILWLAIFGLALAQEPDAALAGQRARVDAIAAQVAQARAEGARRSVLAELMADYRREAEHLAELQAASAPDTTASTHLSALAHLRTALVEGRADEASRQAVGAWLGPTQTRLDLLLEALAAARAQRHDDIRRGLLLDVIEQADALSAITTYDAHRVALEVDRTELRIASLRRRNAPGQGADLQSEADLARLATQLRSLQARVSELERDAALARDLRADALADLESSP